MAEENTTQEYKPWDKSPILEQQRSVRATKRAELEKQRMEVVKARDESLRKYDITAQSSRDAGRILDNDVYYASKHEIESNYGDQLAYLEKEIQALDNADKGLMPDGSPMRPEFFSLIDPKTGLLYEPYQLKIDQYNAKTVDPTQLEDYQAFRKEATREGPSSWAKLMQDLLNQKRMTDLDKATKQSAAAGAQARGQLAMRGGLSSGARERLASQGAGDLLMAKQGIGRDFNMQNLQLLSEDEKNRMAMFNQLPGMEMDLSKYNTNILNEASKGNIEAQAKAREFNIISALEEKRAADTQDMDVYKEQQKKWAAERQSEATRNSGGGGGGCCFIFLEARYGNGVMDEVVRKYRDEHMTEKNVRGYHKLSEVLVPLMRKSKAVKLLVRVFMTDPMVSYGKYHYGKNSYGFIFKPVVKFWLGLFDYLGLEHQYIRESGEVV